jgi:hypothetical protein
MAEAGWAEEEVAEQEVMASYGEGVDEGDIRVGVDDCSTTVTASTQAVCVR